MTTERSAPNPTNPFVGLRPFRTEESLLFFGRNEQTVELLQQLHKTRFLAVVGSSGCGKSSLIRAGLIPKLKAGFLIEDRDRWLTATMKPGDAPLSNLAAALLEAAFGDTTDARIDDFVKSVRQLGAGYITTRLAAKLGDSSPTNLLLLVDQFEEIFRFGVDSNNAAQREEAEDFVGLMLALAEQRTLPIYVVMTMRSDFIGDCDNFYGLPEAMNRSQYLVPRLTRQQRQQAIEGPIRLFGASITPRLLDRVLNDVGDKSDQLPVMQHALMRTFEAWQTSGDAEVDINHYEAIGTIQNALSRDADAALEGMGEEELKITELMFQALTGTDKNNRRIRRPVHLSSIAKITSASRDLILDITERFQSSGRAFLTLTSDKDPLINISHESLIQRWEQLRNWVDKELRSRDIYLELVQLSSFYAQKKRNVLTNREIAKFQNWIEENAPNEAWAARYTPKSRVRSRPQSKRKPATKFSDALAFLAHSIETQKKLQQQREEWQQRKAEFERERSENEQSIHLMKVQWEISRKKELKIIVFIVLISFSLVMGLAWYGVLEEANNSEHLSEYRQSLAEGLSLASSGQLDEAILKYDKAVNFKPSFAEAYLYRGIAYLQKGERDKAVVDLERAQNLPSILTEKDIVESLLRQLKQASDSQKVPPQ